MSSAYRTHRRDSSQPSCVASSESQVASASHRPSKVSPQLPHGFRFAVANAGDHVAIRQFLVTVSHGPTEEDFAAEIGEPLYEPSDRLLIKREETIVAHVLTRKRVLQMGNVGVPVGQVCELAALPEYRGKGLTTLLLQAAEQAMLCEGAVMAVTRTGLPDFFRPLGWGSYVPHCLSTAGLRSLIRELTESPKSSQQTILPWSLAPKLDVRPWRQMELHGLRSLYDAELGEKVYGAWARSEPHWRWLIERRGYDQIYVATQSEGIVERTKVAERGRPKSDTEVTQAAEVVAYAVVRADQVLELVAHNGNTAFSRPLLTRVCADALERGYHEVTLHAHPEDPVHAWFRAAGHSPRQLDNLRGMFLMGKVLDVQRILETMLPILSQRLTEKVRDNWHLSLHIGENQVLLEWRETQLQVVPNKTARNYVTMNEPTFLSLICGQIDTHRATITGDLTASTKRANERLTRLFCRVPFAWQAWDG